MAARTGEGTTTPDDGGTGPAAVEVPDSLTSPKSKLVYLYLATHGAVTECELCDGLDMKRISLYSVLKTLRKAELIEESGGTISLA